MLQRFNQEFGVLNLVFGEFGVYDIIFNIMYNSLIMCSVIFEGY